jgi:hypothetical protein
MISHQLRSSQRPGAHWTSVAVLVIVGAFAGKAQAQAGGSAADAARLFESIRTVLQHPRCQNCHIPGNSPLQLDQGRPHAQNVLRGANGKGMPAMQCSTCHQERNLPAAYGDHAPPGASHWQLPPSDMRMVFKDLSPRNLCLGLKDPRKNGGRNLQALVRHFAEDQLVAWGWNPGGKRSVPPLTKEQTVAAVKEWVAAGAPCPGK